MKVTVHRPARSGPLYVGTRRFEARARTPFLYDVQAAEPSPEGAYIVVEVDYSQTNLPNGAMSIDTARVLCEALARAIKVAEEADADIRAFAQAIAQPENAQ